MRSVVVVLPASMCAMMPMLRVRSRGTWRGMTWDAAAALPAVVGESLVGLRHAMRVLLLLDRPAASGGGVEQLASELLDHRLLGACAGGLYQPSPGARA